MEDDKKKRRGAGAARNRQGNAISKEQMIKALEVASYLIPAGAGINAIRLGYKALKAGQKVKQFSQIGRNNIAQLKAKRDAAKAAGDTAKVKLYNQQLKQAGGQLQGRTSAAGVAKFQANKKAGQAAAATVPAAVAGAGVAAGSKNRNNKNSNTGGSKNRNNKNKDTSNTGGSTTAAFKKANVAPKTIVGNEYSSKLKRNLSDFEQAYINARRAGKKTFPFKGETISSDLDTRPMKKSK